MEFKIKKKKNSSNVFNKLLSKHLTIFKQHHEKSEFVNPRHYLIKQTPSFISFCLGKMCNPPSGVDKRIKALATS